MRQVTKPVHLKTKTDIWNTTHINYSQQGKCDPKYNHLSLQLGYRYGQCRTSLRLILGLKCALIVDECLEYVCDP